MSKNHEPVLLKETIEILDLQQGNIVVDGTYGFGGHSREILKRIGDSGKLIAIERDREIFDKALGDLRDKRVTKICGNFANISEILSSLKIKKVDKVFLDLGLSSYHFDSSQRGFSFESRARLDMRLNPEGGINAYEVVNTLSEKKIADILYLYGDERKSRKIARMIVAKRKQSKIGCAYELASLVERILPRFKRDKIHPATKTFQAIRIFVNDELENFKTLLDKSKEILHTRGIVAVISFHSGEDRIVKQFFKQNEEFEILTKKPVIPSRQEIDKNARSRSAKLRAARRK